MAQYTMARGYTVFFDGKPVAHAETKGEAEALVEEFKRNERIAKHEAEDKNCPDGGGRVAPAGKHWVRNIMNGTWVLEANGTPWTASVQSETYWSS